MKIKFIVRASLFLFYGCFLLSCDTAKHEGPQILKVYPAENLDGVISLSYVVVDSLNYVEGTSSLKVSTEKPRSVKLFETGDVNVENSRIGYQAKLKSVDLNGDAYLEMWCHFPARGEFYSKALHSKISGDTDWSSHEAVFTLTENENPDNIKLNLVINGSGTVWIDDIKLVRIPLPK